MPGVIDEHYHCFGGYGWETYENSTRGAAKGGVTSVIDMPLDKPATLTADAAAEQARDALGYCHVDYACFGGYLAEDPDQMAAMAEPGVAAFKLFTGGVAPPGMYPGRGRGREPRRLPSRGGAWPAVHRALRERPDRRLRRRRA